MKKLIVSLAAMALLASCSQNEVYEYEMGEASHKIKFSTLNDKVTKHANDNKSNYRVFANLMKGEVYGDYWFMNEEIEPANPGSGNDLFNNYTSGDKITSGNTFYWPANDGWTLNFYAFAPNDRVYALVEEDNSYKSLKITYTVPLATETGGSADAQEDFTIAVPQSFTDETKPSENNVHFQFKHMLTKVSVGVKLDEALMKTGYTINYKDNGFPSLYVPYVKGTIDATDIEAGWTDLKDKEDTDGPEDGSYNYTTYNGSTSYYILPQYAGYVHLGLPIEIKKNGIIVYSGDIKYSLLASFTGDFKPGKMYNFTISISGSSTVDNGTEGADPIFGPEITFSSEVADWETDGDVSR